MKIVANTPDPTPQPPTTFDLVGLTGQELGFLAGCLGRSISNGRHTIYYKIERLAKEHPEVKPTYEKTYRTGRFSPPKGRR